MIYRRNLMVVAVGFCSLFLLLCHVVDGWTCPPPPPISTTATASRRRRAKYAVVPSCDYKTSRQRWSGAGWFSRERRLYSEPVISTSSTAAAAASSSKSSSSNNVTSTTTVLPFMAAAQSVATHQKATNTNRANIDIPSSSSTAPAAAISMTTEINDTSMPLTDNTVAAATSPIVTNGKDDVPHPTPITQPPFDIVDHDIDIHYMKIAIELAQLDGGEHGPRSAYPNPTVGAVLVSTDSTTGISTIIGRGRSDYRTEAVRACMEDAGYVIASLSEWVVTYPIRVVENDVRSTTTTPAIGAAVTHPTRVRQNITLYTTLEPSTRRRGTATPPVTNLIRVANVQRVVIGCPSPVPEKAMLGATALHSAGIEVTMIQDPTIRDECQNVIRDFTISSNCKLQRMARKHFQLFGRPLGFLHCSVIHSDNIEAFRRNGNAFSSSTTC